MNNPRAPNLTVVAVVAAGVVISQLSMFVLKTYTPLKPLRKEVSGFIHQTFQYINYRYQPI